MTSIEENHAADNDLSENDEDDLDPEPCWIGKGRKERVVFPQRDLNIIHLHFRDVLVASPSKRVRIQQFKKIMKKPEMRSMLTKYGEQTLLSKVRTERKKCLGNKN